MKKVQKLADDIREWLESMQESKYPLDCGDLSEINDLLDKHAPIEKPFPKYMLCEDNAMVVYFYKDRHGIIMSPPNRDINANCRQVGYSSESWYMENFKDCEIEVKK